jgi:hypothetical protein
MPISRGIAPLADIPDGNCRDGAPELVIRGEHPVIAMPVLSRRWHEIGQPVEEVTRREFYDAVLARPHGLAPAPRADPTSASRSFPMICSAVNFFPRGISCPPLVCATRDSLSESGDV